MERHVKLKYTSAVDPNTEEKPQCCTVGVFVRSDKGLFRLYILFSVCVIGFWHSKC